MKTFFGTLAIGCALLACQYSVETRAQSLCVNVLKGSSSVWRSSPPNIVTNEFMAFRSNSPHFWAWSKENAFHYLNKAFWIEGIVAGDPHLLNFGQVVLRSDDASARSSFKLIDFDDSGRAPLLLDFVRLWASIDLSTEGIKNDRIFSAYLAGLSLAGRSRHQENKIDPPNFILKSNEKLNHDFDKIQKEFLETIVQNDQFIDAANGLQKMESAPESLQKTRSIIHKTIKKEYPDFDILDWAWMQRQTGGSQGMNRLWVLGKRKHKTHVIEFKQMAEPATAQFQAQLPNQDRINEVKKIYWGTTQTAEYSVLNTGTGQFLMRSRSEYPLNRKIKKRMDSNDRHALDEISVYLAYQLGKLHSQQANAKDLVQLIQKHRDQVFDSLKEMKNDYLRQVKKLFNKDRHS